MANEKAKDWCAYCIIKKSTEMTEKDNWRKRVINLQSAGLTKKNCEGDQNKSLHCEFEYPHCHN